MGERIMFSFRIGEPRLERWHQGAAARGVTLSSLIRTAVERELGTLIEPPRVVEAVSPRKPKDAPLQIEVTVRHVGDGGSCPHCGR